jgi:flagellar basal body P-ring formation protein FlgA
MSSFRPRLRASLLSVLFVCAGMAGAQAADGSASHPPDAIRAAAIAAVGAPADAEATMDPALRLPRCAQPLQASASGPRTALVRCPDAPGWRVYVPVQSHREADVVVLAAAASPGVPITSQQLIVQRRDLATLTGTAFNDPAALAGRVPRRLLAAGTVPTEADFAVGATLRRGDPVVLVARSGGVEVRMQGRALGSAQAGGRITVENTASRRILRGQLGADGTVEVLP